VLKPAVDLVCDPHYLNSKLYGWLSYKERLVAKAKRKYLYAATYELFMEMIEQCTDIEQLKHIRFIDRLITLMYTSSLWPMLILDSGDCCLLNFQAHHTAS